MKKKSILIFAILFLLIIPVTVFATNTIISSIIDASEKEINIDYSKLEYSKEEYSQNRKHKADMLNQYIEDNYEKIQSKTQKIQTKSNDLELEDKITKSDEKISDNIQYIIGIVKKYYPNEVTVLLQEAEAEENELKNAGIYKAISNAECKLINLIIKVIEQKTITKDEMTTLKEYISNQDFKLKEIGELELLKKIENILNK